MYEKQVDDYETSLCIKEVAKRQVTNTAMNRVAEAIQVQDECTVYLKTVQVMFRDGVDEESREVEAKKKNEETAQWK